MSCYNTESWQQKTKNEIDEVLLSCPKCHGAGTYRVPIIADNGGWTDKWESCKCEVCNGTGKITLEFYEELQRGCRR